MHAPFPSEPGLSRYAALAAALRGRIVAGEWAVGRALPAEQALAVEHGVALGTLRRALALLVEQGLIERVHGRGTFVRAGLSGAPMLRFFRFGAALDEVPGSRILARRVATPPAEVAEAFGAAPDAPALQLDRLRTLGGQPCLLETLWLPLPRFEALVDSDPAGWGDLLYPMWAEHCGVRVHRVVDTIGFCLLKAGPAAALGLPAGHPCARVARRAYDLNGLCVEWRTTFGDARAFHYTVSIT